MKPDRWCVGRVAEGILLVAILVATAIMPAAYAEGASSPTTPIVVAPTVSAPTVPTVDAPSISAPTPPSIPNFAAPTGDKPKQTMPVLLRSIEQLLPKQSSTKKSAEVKEKPKSHIVKRYVRVLLGDSIPSPKLSSDALLEVTDISSGRPLNIGNMKTATITKHPKGMKVGKLVFPVLSISVTAGSGFVYYKGRAYRGQMLLKRSGSRFHVINRLPIEEYLQGVIPSEMPADWQIEALKTQAVAARTYTVSRQIKTAGKVYDVVATTGDQVYRGMAVETEHSNRAVQETRGEILRWNGEPITAYYHSTSGKKTESSSEVFSKTAVPYLQSVACGFDKESPHSSWQLKLTYKGIRKALRKKGIRVGKITRLSGHNHTRSGRLRMVSITSGTKTVTVKATIFRAAIGVAKLKSTMFSIRNTGKGVNLSGSGFGHGVGMCQWGARGMAEKNYTYKQILGHYYKGAVLGSI